jgi:hypothetical protein
MRNYKLYAGIRREPTSRVQRCFHPNMALTNVMESHASSYRVPPLEHDIDNIPRATPKKLCFLIYGIPPKPGTYSCQGTTFLDVRHTAAPLNA